MSIDAQVALFSWLAVTMVVFLVSALLLDGGGTREKDRIWIGRVGLAAPLWPLIATGAIIAILFLMARELYKAARGRA